MNATLRLFQQRVQAAMIRDMRRKERGGMPGRLQDMAAALAADLPAWELTPAEEYFGMTQAYYRDLAAMDAPARKAAA